MALALSWPEEARAMNRCLVLLGGLVLGLGLLAGCLKQPELGQPGAAAVGPQPGASTGPAGPSPAPPGAGSTPGAGDIPVTRPTPPTESPVSSKPPVGTATSTALAAVPLKDIYFDFDGAAIRDDQKPVLAENVAWLKANPTVTITIEGHADERGSNEYNLGLGDRRAKVTREFLVAAGINAARIATISYGEERPFVLGHDEGAWRWNRRAHFAPASR